jgi:hypothetical protein
MCDQRFKSVFENRTWQVWTVAVESDDTPLMIQSKMRKHRREGCTKTFTFLPNYAHFLARQASKFICVRAWGHDGNFHIAQGPRQRQRVLEKAAIKLGNSLKGQTGSESGLNRTPPRCFRHDY